MRRMAAQQCAPLQDMCAGLAAAVISGGALFPSTLAALRQCLPNADSFRSRLPVFAAGMQSDFTNTGPDSSLHAPPNSISLVDKSGEALLLYPVLVGGHAAEGRLAAVAKCRDGTAAWEAFQTSCTLQSNLLPGM